MRAGYKKTAACMCEVFTVGNLKATREFIRFRTGFLCAHGERGGRDRSGSDAIAAFAHARGARGLK
ncbi:hypothetical protein [Paraburkholderia piptadeniae]|uniref:hypothetical protein n=1 Tax=Paraburkholderia piptadeniae TaxID=1701573 RepID=UPI00117E7169|nr:hypothetical protein [Paraburkholderia piptadeniae]